MSSSGLLSQQAVDNIVSRGTLARCAANIAAALVLKETCYAFPKATLLRIISAYPDCNVQLFRQAPPERGCPLIHIIGA